MNTALHIAPQLPPAIDGVGDYCWNLWRNWPERETRWQFAVLHGAAASASAWPAVNVHGFTGTCESLRNVLEQSQVATVVLHYVSYGFQPKGIPTWLPEALEQWRSSGSQRRLITMFHEMYATSSPLRSPFWVKPIAVRIIRRLVRASDAWVTNCQHYRQWLTDEFGAEPSRGALIPIGSNVPAAQELFEERLWPMEYGRKLRAVIFGLPNTRIWALEKHERFLSALVEAEFIESIMLTGKSSASHAYLHRIRAFQERIGGEWRSEFDLPANEVADLLAASDLGFIANDPGTLTKSGVFAAMASNGVVCVVAAGKNGALPTGFSDCVLLNDDTEKGFLPLINELSGVNRMTARRRAILRVARNDLSWSNVAAQWKTVLGTAAALVPAPEQAPAGAQGRMVVQEVRA